MLCLSVQATFACTRWSFVVSGCLVSPSQRAVTVVARTLFPLIVIVSDHSTKGKSSSAGLAGELARASGLGSSALSKPKRNAWLRGLASV